MSNDRLVISSITAIGAARADSTRRRNTFSYIRFKSSVESLCRCLPAQRFSGARIDLMGNGALLPAFRVQT